MGHVTYLPYHIYLCVTSSRDAGVTWDSPVLVCAHHEYVYVHSSYMFLCGGFMGKNTCSFKRC